LSREAEDKIQNLYAIITACAPKKNLVIEGHASCEGDCKAASVQEKNFRLSEERAETVRKAFVRLGFPTDSISVKGYGTDRPISRIEAENRRVEILVTK
jgi:flagellar motor protein MotB